MKRVPMLPSLCALAALIVGCVDEGPSDGMPMGPSFQVQAGAVPNPVVTGPIPATAPPGSPTHAYPFFAAAFDHAAAGYVEEEFFIEGTARRYTLPDLATGTVLDDGHPFRTRMIVRRPTSKSDFNGTVVMEWQNATVGHDFDGLWLAGAGHFMRRGYALVAVSVQWWGVQLPGLGLRSWSPDRYGTLDVTDGWTILDDALAFDIFSQAAQAIREPQGVDPMGGLGVKRIIAAGISQGAGQLARYHNSLQPLTGMFDAFLLMGGGGLIRTDLAVPVFKFYSETDVVSTMTPQAPLRQPNTAHFRRWEIAGAAHVPFHFMQEFTRVRERDVGPLVLPSCDQPPQSRIPIQYPMNAAFDHLVDWVVRRSPPPVGNDIEIEPDLPLRVVRDADGNALGGIRLSQHAVPTATNSGVNTPFADAWCRTFGFHLPFHQDRLNELYASHQAYTSQVIEATHAAQRAGYIVGHDAAETISAAAQSDTGRR